MGVIDTHNAFLAAFNAQQWDKVANYLTDDFTLTTNQGSDNKQEFLDEFKATFGGAPDYHVTVANMRVDGNTIQGQINATGTQTKPFAFPGMPPIPATGKHFTIAGDEAVTVRGDKIAAIRINMTTPGIASQLGIQPPA